MARAERCCSAVKGSDNKTPTILVKSLSQRGWSYTCGFLGGAEESEEEPALECRGWHRSDGNVPVGSAPRIRLGPFSTVTLFCLSSLALLRAV